MIVTRSKGQSKWSERREGKPRPLSK